MPKEKKESFISNVDKKNLALTVAGGGTGVALPLTLKLYADPSYPDGLPYIKEFVPWPWSSPSTFISMVGGAVALIAGIFIKPARYALLPFGITALTGGVMLALITPESSPGGRLRPGQKVPAGLKTASPGQIRLIQAGSGSPGGSTNAFMQKNPEARLAELKREEADIETQKQITELEEQNRFKKSQPTSAIPLRT